MSKKEDMNKQKQAMQEKEATSAQSANSQDQANAEFVIQRIYVKDMSYEAPNTPQILPYKDWHPVITLDIHSQSMPVDARAHEVVLTITATAKVGEQTAFLAEVRQAGIFTVGTYPEEQLRHLLGSYCPNILFPFAREVISDLVVRGGFPAFYLAPINFDAMYQQFIESQKAKAPSTDTH